MSSGGWIGFDLDGTLAHYDGWRGVEHIGEPIPLMIALANFVLDNGIEVRIFTARVAYEVQAALARPAIQEWFERHTGHKNIRVTCMKDMEMILLYDDRCVTVEKNTGRLMSVASSQKPPVNHTRTCTCGNTFVTAVDAPDDQGCWDCAPPLEEPKPSLELLE